MRVKSCKVGVCQSTFFCIPFIADTRIHIIKADHDVYYNRRENKNNDQHIESLEQQSYTDTIIK